MAVFGITPVDPAELLRRLVIQLQQSGTPSGSNLPGAGWSDRAFISMFPDKLHLLAPVAPQFVAVRPENYPVWQSVVTGSGAPITSGASFVNLGFDSTVVTTVFLQNSSDPEYKNPNAVTEATLGLLTPIMKTISALQFWTPSDVTTGEILLREYARITDNGFKIIPVDGKDGPWIMAPITWQLRFTALLPTN